MEFLRRLQSAVLDIDRALLVALALAFAFTLQGIDWGRVECWNPDEMALRSLFKKGRPPFEPATFTKPPFHTYLNYFIVLKSVHVLEGWEKKKEKYLEPRGEEQLAKNTFNEVTLLGSRFLTLALFLGSVTLTFGIARRFFGLLSARVTVLLMGTGAGFIEFNQFLTADSPMIFWMLLALFFCQRIVTRGTLADYLLAGFFVGIGTATKYNALAMGMAIPVAHLLRLPGLKQALMDRRVYLGVFMAPLSFILACPYAVLDYHTFVADFMYNYTVTPHYQGQVGGHSYLDFLHRVPQILGLPGAIFAAVATCGALILVLLRKTPMLSVKGFVVCASVVVLYYLKIASFSRLETRFVLPVVPLLLLMMGPFLELCNRRTILLYAVLAPVLVYNCICSFYVGVRFNDDPRMAAQTWVRTHIANGASIESTQSCSNWNRLPGVRLDMRPAPNSNARGALFAKLFGGNAWVTNSLEEREGHVNEADFTPAALQARNPEYVAVDSAVYDYLAPGPVQAYFMDLLAERYPYRVVFDLASPAIPGWIYPREIDFLRNRITILQRVSSQ
jgi:hypothetical protein